MAQPPRLSDAEWDVMREVWQAAAPITALEIAQRLAPSTGWNTRTVKTMLGRLVEKGALDYEAQGNRYLYRPKISREACLDRAGRSFLDRVFCGDPQALVLHFARRLKLSPAELDELRQILADKTKPAVGTGDAAQPPPARREPTAGRPPKRR